MQMKNSLLGGVALGVLLAAGLSSGADAKIKKHHHVAAAEAGPSAEDAKVSALADEIESLKARLDSETLAREQSESQIASAQTQAAAAQADAQEARSQLAEQIQTLPGQVKTAVDAVKPKTDKIYYKGVTVTLGGFAEAAGIYRSHDETADISSSFSKIPFANDRAGHTPETVLTGRQSRYSALVQGDINPTTHAAFYGEFDFQGGAQTANSNQSDSYNPRVRNLYGSIDWDDSGWHLLAGQNWSLVTMNTKGISPRNELTPPQIDAQYIPGFAWARQPQFRLTKDFDKTLWVALSVENPQTTLSLNGTNSGVATGVTVTDNQAPTNGFYSGTNYSTSHIPDVVAKVALEEPLDGHNLHVEAFGILRDFSDRTTIAPAAGTQAATLGYAAGTSSNDTLGGGFGAGVNLAAVPKILDLDASVMTGQGIGRYGSAGLPDATARPDGHLEGIKETMWLAGATLHPTSQLDVYVFGGSEQEGQKVYRFGSLPGLSYGYGTVAGANYAGCLTEGGSCSPLTRSVTQITAGFWDRFYQGPFGRLQVGVQYSYTERKTFEDATASGLAPKATENMIFTSFRYYPF